MQKNLYIKWNIFSELFEWPFVGKDFELYRKNIPKAKQYAWTWDMVYKEHKKRLENYINNNVDGIITLSQDIKKICLYIFFLYLLFNSLFILTCL